MRGLPKKPADCVRLIAAADLHLGRKVPIPEFLYSDATSPEGAWQRVVDLVVDEEAEVDVLLLAGDIFDKEENVLEAPYCFERGLQRLAAKDKPVIAIAGNHDYRSLQRRHRLFSFPQFYLLGQGGVWETIQLTLGERVICFEGWSFPSSTFVKNPLLTLGPKENSQVTIGLLHGECDGKKESPYAPFTTQELARTGRECWVLGHIHNPEVLCQEPYIFYCGTLQGLDSSEKGPRGVWVIDIDRTGRLHPTFFPIAGAIWMEVIVNITGVDIDDYEVRLQQELTKDIPLWEGLGSVAIEVIWQGKTHDMNVAVKRIQEIQGMYLSLNKNGSLLECMVHTCKIDIRPEIDLLLLSNEKTIVGLLANQLLLLEQSVGGESRSLLFKLREFLEQAWQRYPYFMQQVDDHVLKQELISKGYQILAELLEQQEKIES
ncbi:MAG: DNA repair exonuclease [Simkania sp.]|nr:DNA repair exonuclease [Simkania sp.]